MDRVGSRKRENPRMDIAVNLVENYLRLNGYLTLSEFEIQQRQRDGGWQTVTDVDIVAIRFPGPLYAGDDDEAEECRFILIEDAGLGLEDGVIDVIIGEVKQGEAVLNAGMTSHAALHTILQRFEWLFDSDLHSVIDRLQTGGVSHDDARAGGQVRTRLVAFGRSDVLDTNTINLTHVFEQVYGYMRRHDDMLHGAQFKEPAPALLHLLVKTGFEVGKSPSPRPPTT